ncbi:MAG TPA: hypothetical protein VNF49_10810 [Candidatus Binataceae bacterium]|nr:hypothetical protein [Candidatus Binataceae bacterium]
MLDPYLNAYELREMMLYKEMRPREAAFPIFLWWANGGAGSATDGRTARSVRDAATMLDEMAGAADADCVEERRS